MTKNEWKERGSCKEHPEPDLWFPGYLRGTPTLAAKFALADQIKRAFAICHTCPVKAECKAEGMEPGNLTDGLWGETFPGERLIESGVVREGLSSRGLEAKAIDFMVKMYPLVRWE